MKSISAIAGAALLMGATVGSAFAQGAPQNLASIDIRGIETAYRSSKVVGSTVYNNQNESVGKIDDLLISEGRTPYAVLSVGGFLGMGDKLVVVPTELLQVAHDPNKSNDSKIVLPGATKDQLKQLPDYHYAK